MKYALSALAAVPLIALTSLAQADSHKGKYNPPSSRQEAISRTQEHLKKLESMSDADWKKKHEERMERREKWKAMSPEERKAMKESHKGHHDGHGDDAPEDKH